MMTRVIEWWDWVREDASTWCAGENLYWRLPIFLYGTFVALNHLINHMPSDMLSMPLFGLTLAVHELGHVVFQAFGMTLYVAGGSIMQILAPILLAFSFLKQRDYFAISFAAAWLSFSMSNLATYIADSRALQLPLVSLGGGQDTIHDWNYLLDQWGLLSHDLDIAFGVRCVAFVVALASIALGGWTLFRMATTHAADIDGTQNNPI